MTMGKVINWPEGDSIVERLGYRLEHSSLAGQIKSRKIPKFEHWKASLVLNGMINSFNLKFNKLNRF